MNDHYFVLAFGPIMEYCGLITDVVFAFSMFNGKAGLFEVGSSFLGAGIYVCGRIVNSSYNGNTLMEDRNPEGELEKEIENADN